MEVEGVFGLEERIGLFSTVESQDSGHIPGHWPTSQDSSCNEKTPKNHLKKQPQWSFTSFGFCAKQRAFVAIEDK